MKELKIKLDRWVGRSPCWTEIRFHRRRIQTLQVQKALVKQVKSSVTTGIGIRVLSDGAWGFSSTSDLSDHAIERGIKRALDCATQLSHLKKNQIKNLPKTQLASGEYVMDGYLALEKKELGEKLNAVIQAEKCTRENAQSISHATCTYHELFEDKIVVTSDGASVISRLARNEFQLSAVAEESGERIQSNQSAGKTGSWECLFENRSIEKYSEDTARLAVDLLHAPKIKGGMATLILSPAMVGILSHEAIGHTVEADFVLAGSVANGKLNQRVASPLVTLCDGGKLIQCPSGGGDLDVDDEGVLTRNVEIIRQGVLSSYLHNRESAAIFGVEPTGNARSWLYHNEPLIRMRNTYILPGHQTLEEIISMTEDGYLVDCPLGGQADATGEFMFAAQKVTRIEKGKLGTVYRGATISGQAFEVLQSVDAVSSEFKLDLGSGYCGKGQLAKVDAGGPYIRCKAMIGGIQS